MKNHVEQASASNMEDYVSSSQKKGKGFDVVGSDSDIDYKDINNACTTNSERDDKLSASSKGKDISITSSISNPELKIEMTSKILAELTDMMKELPSKPWDFSCIYRVPKSLRNVNWKAYTPQLISVGPLHRGDERLKGMEEQKWRYFKEFAEEQGWVKMQYLLWHIQDKEAYIRALYSENFNEIGSSDFIEMILLDAVFIIKFFQHSNGQSRILKPWMIFDIREDLMLLENQQPYFIIEEIHDKACHARQERKCIPFLNLATVHFGKYMFSQGVQNTDPDVEGSRHFTDLIRSFMLKRSIERIYTISPVKLKYNAVMLRQAGMEFQVTEDKCLVNITFEKGVL